MKLAIFWPEHFSNVPNVAKLEKIIGAKDYNGVAGCHCFEIDLTKYQLKQICRKLNHAFNLNFSITFEPDPDDEDQDWSITGS